MAWTRRDVLRFGVAAAAVPLAVLGSDAVPVRGSGRNSGGAAGRARFDRPLAVPPLAPSRVDGAGRRVFELSARAGQSAFLPGLVTPTWGVNDDYLGPTLRARRGDVVAINVHNGLDEPTTMHWHGMHLPARYDGGPHQPVRPGGTWSATWRVDQPAATLWYHPHPHGRTELHVYRGLAGMFIVDDGGPSTSDLPHEYGVDDVPVIVQDKLFDRDGRFEERSPVPTGLYGDTLLVNGTIRPHLPVTTERVRLRLLNASTARSYRFGLSDGRRFALVGTDGGLLSAPYETDRVQLAPAERAEIVVSLHAGERVVLRSYPPLLGTADAVADLVGARDSFDVLELRAAASLAASPPLPPRLVDLPPPGADRATGTRRFAMLGVTINGRIMDMGRIDEVVTKGATEIWAVTNQDGLPHSFHVHDGQFRVVDVDGAPPPPELAGWKDTVYVPPQSTVRLVKSFPDYADPAVPYMYHCHMLMHEDHGMMGQFVVVEPGQRPSSVVAGDGHH